MIITKQKNIDEILKALEVGPVFLIGCSECATVCHTGGSDEVLEMKQQLEDRRIPVSGSVILDPACHLQNNKRLLKEYTKELDATKKILVLACGNGAQTVAEIFADKQIITGTDTLFLGEISHLNDFDKRCNLCGECFLNDFGGFCPITRCPKSMLNGPCGGSTNGKCEINSELECAWVRIYELLKKQGKLKSLLTIQKPKNWSKELEMKRRI